MPADARPACDAARPRRRAGASSVELDDNLAVYDDVGQLLILLNTSAAAVWERCDGVTTVDDMVRALARAHGADADDIAEDVEARWPSWPSWGWSTAPAPCRADRRRR